MKGNEIEQWRIKMTRYVTSLAVIGYDEGDVQGALEDSANDPNAVIKIAEEELREMGFESFRVIRVYFLEHDSGNISHANAMYEVFLSGIKQEDLDRKMTE